MMKKLMVLSVVALFVFIFHCSAIHAEEIGSRVSTTKLSTSSSIISQGDSGNNVHWSLDDSGLLKIWGNGEITNPEWNASEIKIVEIESGITGIGDSAFSNCSNLTSITIPDSVASISDSAFYACSSLTSIIIPDGVTRIGYSTFSECSSLTSIIIPNSVTRIEDIAFNACRSLTDITIPDSVTHIGHSAFYGCRSLMNITLSENVTSIGDATFLRCSSLTSINIPDSVTSIGDSAFYGCSSLMNITLPDLLTSIGKSVFFDCSSLISITIPDSVTSIDERAFWNCSSLTSITIPDGVTFIGDQAFSNCSAVRCCNLNSSAAHALGKQHFSFRPIGTNYSLMYQYKNNTLTGLLISETDKDIQTLNIPDGVTGIGSSAFRDCSSLANITIPDSVTSIGNSAFYGCSSLASIAIPDGITSIGDSSFYGCSSLASITIPDNITSIENYAFYGCSNLMNITIPDGVTSIGDYAFSTCSSLTSITIPDSVTSFGHSVFSNCSSLASFIIPHGMTSIENHTFFQCSSLTSISIPDSVTNIGDSAFSECSSLMSITIPDGVTSIGRSAFSGCSSLTSFTIPHGVTSIENNTFTACRHLVSITIPDNVTRIGEWAFSDCSSLKSVTIPGSVTNIEWVAFYRCHSLTNVTILNGTSSIGASAFFDCKSLINISIPDSVTTIGGSAFRNCISLTNITIPDSVTTIEGCAFMGCYNLNKLCFMQSDTVSVTFGSNVVDYPPTIYCFEYSDVDSWATENELPIIYMDSIDYDSIRTVTLQEDIKMASGETLMITPYIFPDNHPDIIWTSSDANIVSVDSQGRVTALSHGKAKITATVGSSSDTIEITVIQHIESFELAQTEAWLIAKESIQMQCINIIPDEAEFTITWTSSDTALASVNENGTVTTKKPGDVIISADTENGIHRECLLHLCYPVTEIAFENIYTISIGTSFQLTANVTMRTQSCINHLISFTSSDTTIAEINDAGVLYAKRPGKVTITATAQSGVSASVTISVQLTIGTAVYEWSDDNSTVTAWILTDDAQRVEEIANAKITVIRSPTETWSGFALYTASFSNPSFSTQEKQITIPARREMHTLRLPIHLQSIEAETFVGVSAEAIIIPDGCKEIGSRAFANCKNLRYVWIPKTVQTVIIDAFAGSEQAVLDYE